MKSTVYKKRKINKKKQARFRRVRKFLTFLLLITVIIFFARSSFFIVENINVSGNVKYTSNDIILRSGLVSGQNVFKMLGEKPKNLFSFRFKDVEKKLYETMPYIKIITIKPTLPKSISIKIQERSPFCILETKGTSLLLDKEGFVLEEIKNTEIKNKYFKIIGISLDSYSLGQAIELRYKEALDNIIEFCDTLIKNDKEHELKLYNKMNFFEMSDINSISVRFDNRITVKFGDLEDIDYKISFFRQLFDNNITEKQKGTVNFTMSKNPYFEQDK